MSPLMYAGCPSNVWIADRKLSELCSGFRFNEVVDGPEVTFAPLTRADFGRLSEWLAEPQIARWWHDDATPEGIEKQYGPSIDGTDPTQVFVVLFDGEPAGLIQRYRLDDEPEFGPELAAVTEVPPHALSIDYFVSSPAHRGQGLGSKLITALVEDSWVAYPDASAVIVPIIAANRPSWRALERAGFRRVGEGPLTPDNPIDPPDHVIYRIDRPAGR
jgi:aminoglycoside 6'-N-acetyltransferase